MGRYVLAIDQGTTSSRAILFDEECKVAGIAQQEFPQYYPKSGWVEHDPEEIWESVLKTCREVMTNTGCSPEDIVSIGITNQRETTVVWDRETGKAVHNAIVWQDSRTAELCESLKNARHEAVFTRKTGLLLNPYFSGTKLSWILANVPGARDAAREGKLAFGTVDSFLLWRLTDGKVHATDATNASRTLLFDINENIWSDELLQVLSIPKNMLPEVKDSAADFGETSLFGSTIRISGIAGDQQAASVGQACFKPGMMKSTYGTGCFALLNTGETPVFSRNKLLTTIAYRLNGKTTYALEGSIFVAGAAVQWLRDGLKLIESAEQSGELAKQADPAQDVYLVPAFVGLGAPFWDAECRGAIYGLSRGTGPNEIALAALESVCYQTRSLLDAMTADWENSADMVLRVDGGMVASDWTMQRLADILDAPVDRPHILETTALGAAYLAGMQVGFYPGLEEFSKSWSLEHRFVPQMDETERARKYAGWNDAVRRTLTS
ncbi:MAG: glycerol kinase GlpK [Methyloligellaceae bacterium]